MALFKRKLKGFGYLIIIAADKEASKESLFKLIEVLVSISDCQDLISRVSIKKIFLSFGLSTRDVFNNLFPFENEFFYILPALEQANAHLMY